MSTLFDVEAAPDDPILGLGSAFRADTRDKKVNLGVGAYQDSEGQPLVLSAVRKAEARVLERKLNKEYPPLGGVEDYIDCMRRVVLGAESVVLDDQRSQSMQTVGGTAACCIIGNFLSSVMPGAKIAMSSPTWANHPDIFKGAGLRPCQYRYYDKEQHCLDFAGMCEDLRALETRSIVLLHAGCHNPTGCDPSEEQWRELSQLCLEQRLIPVFDMAYQGFAHSIKDDAWAIRHFADQGHEMFVASSCSKNFGLYGERVGLATAVASTPERADHMISQMKLAGRRLYSMPPLHGARLVATLLGDQALRQEWKRELTNMRERMREMRKSLVAGLMSQQDQVDFTFMNAQNGMFSLLGISKEQVERLKVEFGVYMMGSSRLNVAGLNPGNISYVVDSIITVLNDA